MDSQNLIDIITVISLLATNIMTFWLKISHRIDNKKLATKFDEHTAKDAIKVLIHERIEIATIEQLKYLKNVNSAFKDILVIWSEKFEDFAINAYFSSYRKSNNVEHYLNSKMGGLLAELDFMLIQKLNVNKGDSFTAENNLKKETDLLVRALVNNGLTDEKYIELFEDSIKRILDEYIAMFQSWDI